MGEPILLSELRIDGISLEAAQLGQSVKLATRLAITSDHPLFHELANNLNQVIGHSARQDGKHINLKKAGTILVVIREDYSAELWADAAAVSVSILMKRSAEAGSVIFESDVADVLGMDFPLVQIGTKDKVICLFREDWSFALYFDFNADGDLDRALMARRLGTLHRILRYRYLYDIMTDSTLTDQLTQAGWFPFVEILGLEFKELSAAAKAGFGLSEIEATVLSKFDQNRMISMLERWSAKPHFAGKKDLFKPAVQAFLANEPVACLKIVLSEIEGVLREAYRNASGKSARLGDLLAFAIASAETKAGGPDTLLFTAAFLKFLRSYTFANFHPDGPPAPAGSRHAVSHGAASAESYTQVRALQALLTLDQLFFYT